VKSYYVRRKDLDHVPFQFYVTREGVARALEEGYTAVFSIIPPKNDIDVFYVRILQTFIEEIHERWGIAQADLLRIAAKGVETWLKNEQVPADHLYGPEWLKVDQDWYPRDPDGSPAMAADPYNFEVISDEPWPSILDWDFAAHAQSEHAERSTEGLDPAHLTLNARRIVFGYTPDLFPAMLIVGYEQMKHKVAQAGLNVQVVLSPLGELPPDTHTLFVPAALEEAARGHAAGSRVQALPEMVNSSIFDSLIEELQDESTAALSPLPAQLAHREEDL
jgi:hypothetical protein